MEFLDTIEKTTKHSVTLYGDAALCALLNLPDEPTRIEYSCDVRLSDDDKWKQLCDSFYKIDYHTKPLDRNHKINVLSPLDLTCYAIHTKNMSLLVDCMLSFLDNFDCTKVYKRYSELYHGLAGSPGVGIAECSCQLPIQTYYNNICKSNIVLYMKKKGISYPTFVRQIPELCSKLNCTEENLNAALGEQEGFD